MKYAVKQLTKVEGGYTAYLESWTGCYCSRETSEKLFIEQDKRPTKSEVVAVWKSN